MNIIGIVDVVEFLLDESAPNKEIVIAKGDLHLVATHLSKRFPERGFHIDAPADSDKATIKKL